MQEIINAYAKALEAGSNVVVVQGKLVENLHVENAKRIISVRFHYLYACVGSERHAHKESVRTVRKANRGGMYMCVQSKS